MNDGARASATVGEALARSIERETRTVLRGGWPARMDGGTDMRSGEEDGAGMGFAQGDLDRVRETVDLLRRLMFPGYFDALGAGSPRGAGIDRYVEELCAEISSRMDRLVRTVYRYADEAQTHRGARGAELERLEGTYSARIVGAFMARLAPVREMLSLDVQAAYDGDPAAEHTDEVVLCYPGLEAIFAQRIGHELYELGVPILPRVISEQAHSRTGIDIHPGAKIGKSFFIDHGSGTVIGETSVIGESVKVYQGVTLGARSFPKDDRGRVIRGIKRHPTIGNRVNLYAGAVILGGDTLIGDDCVIAGGVFVTSSVPPGHVVQQPRADLTLKPHGAGSGGSGGSGKKTDASAGGGVAPKANGAARASDRPEVDVGWLGDGAGI